MTMPSYSLIGLVCLWRLSPERNDEGVVLAQITAVRQQTPHNANAMVQS
ncbi:MAG: hypothetical protein RLZZ117_21 [Cyanobacteriota bacterium]